MTNFEAAVSVLLYLIEFAGFVTLFGILVIALHLGGKDK